MNIEPFSISIINMSYESEMLLRMGMPIRDDVEVALLKALFKHNGVITDFSEGQQIVDEIANEFSLTKEQRIQQLETIYLKENRVKRSGLWHRLLYRAADSLTKKKLVSNPSTTFQLTKRREWMLTELGFDKALRLLNIPDVQKETLYVKSFEVQKVILKINNTPRPENYNPIDNSKSLNKQIKEISVRERGFRQAVLEAYNFRCAFCGLKLKSPDMLLWEVQAAHIVPHSYLGKDDIWNGITLCHLHHWAFDAGWLTLDDDLTIVVSNQITTLPTDHGKAHDYDFLRMFIANSNKIFLPCKDDVYPHRNSLRWHRENRFYK